MLVIQRYDPKFTICMKGAKGLTGIVRPSGQVNSWKELRGGQVALKASGRLSIPPSSRQGRLGD